MESFLRCFIFLSVSFLISEQAEPGTIEKASNVTTSTYLAFGDSTVDSGNNNYLKGAVTCNYLPYGRDLPNHVPTGRCSNGRLVTDFIGDKNFLPPYLDPALGFEDLLTGVSFAFVGSGYDPLTHVLDAKEQIGLLREYKKRLVSVIGEQRINDYINRAGFVVSFGTNDVRYSLPVRLKSLALSEYHQFLLLQFRHFIKGLWDEGARRIGVVGMPPIGCFPSVITLHPQHFIWRRDCVQSYSIIAANFNLMLQKELKFMQTSLAHLGSRIYYADIFGPLNAMIKGDGEFGFEETSRGCCGATGYIEVVFLCNITDKACSDASKYVFWDAVHPSERANYYLFKSLLPVIDTIIKN